MKKLSEAEFEAKRASKQIVYGPIKSRRLGCSLGVNILPHTVKLCSFDCVYCECGFSTPEKKEGLPTINQIEQSLRNRLLELIREKNLPDSITFSGNGEPTLHPDFEEIIGMALSVRDELAPQTKITVLSNATRIEEVKVFRSLRMVDNPILKLDSAVTETMRKIDMPHSPQYNSEGLIDRLQDFRGNLIIQTILVRGEHRGIKFDNTTEEEIEAYLEAIRKICPRQVMLYALDRPAPADYIEKVKFQELAELAARIRDLGMSIDVSVAG